RMIVASTKAVFQKKTRTRLDCDALFVIQLMSRRADSVLSLPCSFCSLFWERSLQFAKIVITVEFVAATGDIESSDPARQHDQRVDGKPHHEHADHQSPRIRKLLQRIADIRAHAAVAGGDVGVHAGTRDRSEKAGLQLPWRTARLRMPHAPCMQDRLEVRH